MKLPGKPPPAMIHMGTSNPTLHRTIQTAANFRDSQRKSKNRKVQVVFSEIISQKILEAAQLTRRHRSRFCGMISCMWVLAGTMFRKTCYSKMELGCGTNFFQLEIMWKKEDTEVTREGKGHVCVSVCMCVYGHVYTYIGPPLHITLKV